MQLSNINLNEIECNFFDHFSEGRKEGKKKKGRKESKGRKMEMN